MSAYTGPTRCCRCHAVLQAAQPGHEQDETSHGLGACCWAAYRAEQGLPATPFPILHAHVAPEPIEAPEPVQPRHRDLVKEKALIVGREAMAAHGRAPHSVADFAVGVKAYEDYRRRNDRRAW